MTPLRQDYAGRGTYFAVQWFYDYYFLWGGGVGYGE
jgi:hypothetical protein